MKELSINKAVINDYVSAKEYAKTAFAGCTDEEYKIICTNNSSKVISCDTLNFKKDKIGNVNPLEIIERMLRRQSATAILVHIKPHGNYSTVRKNSKARPSSQQRQFPANTD